LVLIYDNNQVTCDGPLDWINTEDINSKMGSCGWEVIDVADGRYDVCAIVSALHQAKEHSGKPVFINIRTIIGVDMASAGTAKAHHGAFDAESISRSKVLAGLSPSSQYEVPKKILDFFRERRSCGARMQKGWDSMVREYSEKHPELGAEFTSRCNGVFGEYQSLLDSTDSQQFAGMATRETNGILLERLWKVCPALCGGGADLVNSNKLKYAETDVFHPQLSYKGRYIRNGIREHAMASIANGMAAFNPGTFLPITATFFMFYIYV
jgi:dihydroxyacetone synthase